MIRHEFRTNNRADPYLPVGNRSAAKNKSKQRVEHSESNKENRSGHHQEGGNTGGKRESALKGKLKENTPTNQNTPKRNQANKGICMEDVDQLSQIKFISKEFSSIRDKCNDDCVSFSNSGNNLDDFSPLFDKIERDGTGKEEFTLEICGIDDLDLLYDERKPLFESQGNIKIMGSSNGKSGRIKKNNLPKAMPIPPLVQEPPKFKLQKEILQIFLSLDLHDKKILTKSNCASQRLSTQLNYLIGSILTKIKVKSKEYDYKEFQTEFKRLIADSQQDEVMEILQNNSQKRKELFKNEQLASNLQQHSPEFKKIKAKEEIVAQKLSKINSKLNFYLSKNNLDGFKNSNEVKDMTITNDHKRQKESIMVNRQQPLLKNSKTWDLRTQATQNSKVSCTQESTLKSQVSLKNDVELIKRTDGSIFQLHFSELNKHLD